MKSVRRVGSPVYHDFVLRDECLWDNITHDPSRLVENLSKALKMLAELNPELQGAVDRAEIISLVENPENNITRSVII